jgi:VIT1/CCC1 family predicted Fe2+/Mn2+ transporter
MSHKEAADRAAEVFAILQSGHLGDAPLGVVSTEKHEAVGTGLRAAVSSFLFFASGALIPVLPYLVGLSGVTAVVISAVLVGIALLSTGMIVGLLSGGPPLRRATRQLLIGYGAATVTYLLGLLFGTAAG